MKFHLVLNALFLLLLPVLHKNEDFEKRVAKKRSEKQRRERRGCGGEERRREEKRREGKRKCLRINIQIDATVKLINQSDVLRCAEELELKFHGNFSLSEAFFHRDSLDSYI